MNIKNFLSICAVAAVLAVSCGKPESKKPEINVDNASKAVLVQNSIPADAVEAEKVTFTVNESWHIVISSGVKANDVNWVKVSPDHGEAGTYTLSITMDPNTEPEARSANIEIVCGEASQKISLTQVAAKISIFNQWVITGADTSTGASGQMECFCKSDVEGCDVREDYISKDESGEWHLNAARDYFFLSGDEYGGKMKYENINPRTGKDRGMTYTFSIDGNKLTLTTAGNDGSWTNILYLDRVKEPVTYSRIQ